MVVDLSNLKRSEARAFLEAYVGATEQAIAWLRERVGERLSLDRAGLVEVWEWFTDWWNGPEALADAPRPMWSDETDLHYYRPGQLVGIDAVAHFLGEVLRESFPVEWVLGGGTRSYAYHNRPVLHHVASGRDWSPVSLVLAKVAELKRQVEFEPDALARIFDAMGERIAGFDE